MMSPRLLSASRPVAPTTAAIAPNAPTGATHMIIAMSRNTSRSRCLMPRSTGSPAGPELLQGEADEEGDEEGLEHRPGGQRRHEGVGDEPEEEVGRRLRLRRDLGLAGLGELVGEVQPGARLDDVADDEADGQGDGRHHEEVAEREPADLADLGGPAHRPDAEDDRHEDDRADHHLDEVDEERAERLELLAELREEEPDGDAEQHRHDDGDVEDVRAVAAGPGGDTAVGGVRGRVCGHGVNSFVRRRAGCAPSVSVVPRAVIVTVVYAVFTRGDGAAG